MTHEQDKRRTDEALAASRARHDLPRDRATEARMDVAMEDERRDSGAHARGAKPGDGRSDPAARRLPILAILATLAVIFAGGWGAHALISQDQADDKLTSAIHDIRDSRRDALIAAAKTTLTTCRADNHSDRVLGQLLLDAISQPPRRFRRPEHRRRAAKLRAKYRRTGRQLVKPTKCAHHPLVRQALKQYPDERAEILRH